MPGVLFETTSTLIVEQWPWLIGLEQGSPNFSIEGHIANILKTCGPKLTRINLEVTVSNVGDRAMLPEK